MVGTMLTGITEQNFDDEVLESALPVLVCFTARWCHSCYPTCLVADELAEKYEGKIKFVRVDAERSPEISARYHVRSLPMTQIGAPNVSITLNHRGVLRSAR